MSTFIAGHQIALNQRIPGVWLTPWLFILHPHYRDLLLGAREHHRFCTGTPPKTGERRQAHVSGCTLLSCRVTCDKPGLTSLQSSAGFGSVLSSALYRFRCILLLALLCTKRCVWVGEREVEWVSVLDSVIIDSMGSCVSPFVIVRRSSPSEPGFPVCAGDACMPRVIENLQGRGLWQNVCTHHHHTCFQIRGCAVQHVFF